jgi:hypothetical protein
MDKQFNLEFRESAPVAKKDDNVNVNSEFKNDIIVTKCFYNKNGKCNYLCSAPEQLACPCWQFVSFNKEAISRFNDTVKRFHCVGKIQIHDSKKITYYDLFQLARFRRSVK